MDIVKITNDLPLSLLELEDILRTENSTQIIMNYVIHNIFPNSQIEGEMELKETFINEGIEIILKLSLIIQKYMDKHPNQYVNIDLDNQWFRNEEPFIIDETIQNLFLNKKKISEILAIICKLVDFINNNYLMEIDLYEKRIFYISQQPPNSYLIILTDELSSKKVKCIEKFKEFHSKCGIIRNYILSIYETNNIGYLGYIPKITLNIFSSSLYFLNEDEDDTFLNFIIEFCIWIPSNIRCKYISKILSLENNNILRRFKPNLSLLIVDCNTLYKEYLKDSLIIDELILITHVICSAIKYDGIITLNNDILIYYISVELSIISKFKSIKDDILIDDYYEIINKCFNCIKYIINNSVDILKSYLTYYILNIILDFDDKQNAELSLILDEIFLILMNNKLSIIYLCSIKDSSYLLNINASITEFQKDKIKEWTSIYSKMTTYEYYDEFIDQLTSCIIVIPCCIPLNTEGTILQICDEYMLSSYLWTTPINPYTRISLSLDELKEFNKKEHCIYEIKKFMSKLKDGIEYGRK